jgi:hypothetical protein
MAMNSRLCEITVQELHEFLGSDWDAFLFYDRLFVHKDVVCVCASTSISLTTVISSSELLRQLAET